MLSPNINPRRYDVRAAVDAWLLRRPNGASHAEAINCSEFILECFAIAGPYMVKEYIDLKTQKNTFFFPAHFAADAQFDHLPTKYYRYVPSPENPRDAAPEAT